MDKCSDMMKGILLPRFELGQLEPDEKELFLQHLATCRFCRQEISSFKPLLEEVLKHRFEFKELYESYPEFQADPSMFTSSLAKMKREGMKILHQIEQHFAGTNEIVTSPFFNLIKPEPFPMPAFVFRSGGVQKSVENIRSVYINGHYKEAIDMLKVELSDQPNDWMCWFFIGVCCFLSSRPSGAIQGLLEAEKYANGAMQSEINWYLAQSYLLANNMEKGKDRLLWFLDRDSDNYHQPALNLLAQLQGK